MNVTKKNLSRLVKRALISKNLSLEECCYLFNNKHLGLIESKKMKPLNKDFVSRVSRNDFKVISERVSKLCEFLEIERIPVENDPLELLASQIDVFEKEIDSDINFKNKYSAIHAFLNGLNITQFYQGELK